MNRGEWSEYLKVLDVLGIKLSSSQIRDLERPFSEVEVREAIFQMKGSKAPGPDGFVAGFYQRNWDWVGKEVAQMVLAFLHWGIMLREINRTYITLIPKVPNPSSVIDFWPISSCNVLYKVIT